MSEAPLFFLVAAEASAYAFAQLGSSRSILPFASVVMNIGMSSGPIARLPLSAICWLMFIP